MMRAVVMKIRSEAPRLAGRSARVWKSLTVAALAFACGAGLAHSARHAPRVKADAAALQSAPQPSPSPCPAAARAAYDAAADLEAWTHTPALLEWENGHNGAPLPLRYDEQTLTWGLAEGKVFVTPSGRTLAAAGDTLYMLDADRRRVLWEYSTWQLVFDFVYVEATGVVCATAGDNVMFILDASTGRELYVEGRNGRASYGAVLPYGEDACLVMDSFGGYRAGYRGDDTPIQDGVTAWRGTKMLWRRDVPPDAALQVVGKRIYAVTKTKTRILVEEIKAPKGAR
jgi:hypothetical protein